MFTGTVYGSKPGKGSGSSTPPSPVQRGRTLFVSKRGNDSTGTREDVQFHYLEIATALNAASSGDMVIVYPGPYDETLTDLQLNGKFLHLMPGVVLSSSSGPTIRIDDVDNEADIYISGLGVITNGGGFDTIQCYPALGGSLFLECLKISGTEAPAYVLYGGFVNANIKAQEGIFVAGSNYGINILDSGLVETHVNIESAYIGSDLLEERNAGAGEFTILSVNYQFPGSSLIVNAKRIAANLNGAVLFLGHLDGGNNKVIIQGGTIENCYNGLPITLPVVGDSYGQCVRDTQQMQNGALVHIKSDIIGTNEADGFRSYNYIVAPYGDQSSTFIIDGNISTGPDGEDNIGVPVKVWGNTLTTINVNGKISGYSPYVVQAGYYDGSPSSNASKNTPMVFTGLIQNLGGGHGIRIEPFEPDTTLGVKVAVNCRVLAADTFYSVYSDFDSAPLYVLDMQANQPLNNIIEKVNAAKYDTDVF